MLHVTVLCSDADCAELVEFEVESLAELDGLTCGCGYGAVLLRVAELAPV
jgi:Na+-transporting NADH:ubiquinone oxidoreductase subunit NqrD